jgi:hypothetical protein
MNQEKIEKIEKQDKQLSNAVSEYCKTLDNFVDQGFNHDRISSGLTGFYYLEYEKV